MKELDENIHIANPVELGTNENFYILNVSDVHYDSRKCNRKLLKKHFDQAKERNAKILINGDWLDVMGMKHDPRSIPNEIRPEYMKAGGSYLDLVIQDSYEFLKDYKDNILLIGYGNHETNIVKRQQIDPLKYLAALLNKLPGEDIKLGAYKGVIVNKFIKKNSTSLFSNYIYYHHGAGGGAKRSKGILDADILVSQNGWADIITSGHDHQKWHLPYEVLHFNKRTFQLEERRINILRTGSYKLKSRNFGWEVEKAFNQPTLGGYWIKYTFNYIDNCLKLIVDIEEAK